MTLGGGREGVLSAKLAAADDEQAREFLQRATDANLKRPFRPVA